MRKISVGSSGDCAAGRDCFPLQASRSAKKAWISQSDVMLAKLNNGDFRHMVHVMYVTRMGPRAAIMDCITGTMYRDGRCLTSDVLCIESLDIADHSDGLLAAKGPDWGDFTRKTPV